MIEFMYKPIANMLIRTSKTVERRETKMFKEMKMSKFNFVAHNCEGDIVLYNFLSGIKSITKVQRKDVDKFAQMFLSDDVIYGSSDPKYIKTFECLINKGILVANDVDENSILESNHYSQSYDNELCLTILPTGECNFRCPYCYETSQSFHRKAMTVESQDAFLRYIHRSISNYKGIHVAWFGGEPLLEPEIIKRLSEEMIAICNKRYLPFWAEIVTNGYLLDAEMFDMLYKLRVYTYMITIDGFEEQHDKLRCLLDGTGTYNTIISNLRNIRDSKQYKFAHVIVRINVSAGFFDRFDEFASFLAEEFANDSRFEFMFVPVTMDVKETKTDLIVDPNELSFRLTNNESYINNLSNEKEQLSLILPEPQCIAAKKHSYVITPDLSLYKCYSHFESKENKIGSIDIRGNLVIDESLHRRWYLSSRYLHKSPKACDNCFYLPCCRCETAGCPIRYPERKHRNSCRLTEPNFKQKLTEAILYAARTKQCTILPI